MKNTPLRILLINHYAGSPEHGREYRPFYFARKWVQAGYRVMIVAASYSHLRQVNPTITGILTPENIEGVEYLWVKTPSYQGSGFGRFRNMLAFVIRLWTACFQAIAAFRPTIVIASSTYTWDNWIAARYARAFGAKYVYEVHDLWPMTPMELAHMSRWHPFIWSLQIAEDYACQRADKVISLLPGARPHLVAHGMLPEHFAYIPNGIASEEWENPQPIPEAHLKALLEIRRDTKCVVGYVGGHSTSNSLDVLVESGVDSRLRYIGIVCVGDGLEKKRLVEKAKVLGSHVYFLDPVPKRAIPTLLKFFDILYVGWAQASIYKFGISPNKLFEYMMAGVPVLHAVSAANDPVREAGCGLSIEPSNKEALCNGILELAALTPEERHAMGIKGQYYVEKHHQIKSLAQQFLDCIWD